MRSATPPRSPADMPSTSSMTRAICRRPRIQAPQSVTPTARGGATLVLQLPLPAHFLCHLSELCRKSSTVTPALVKDVASLDIFISPVGRLSPWPRSALTAPMPPWQRMCG